jgi:hypothetical protein
LVPFPLPLADGCDVLASEAGTALEVPLPLLLAPLALPLPLLLDVPLALPLFCAVVALGAGIESLAATTNVLSSGNGP